MKDFIKIPNEDALEENFENHISNLCKTTKDVYDEILNEKKFELICSMANCESPIEQIMALRLNEYWSGYKAVNDRLLRGIDIIGIDKQVNISIDKNKYRADFEIAVHDDYLKKGYIFIIECDGHNFHEKTKAQAQRDKKRDRDITASGRYVMRYTGSEVYNNEYIAEEIFRDIKKIILNLRGE